MAQNTFPEKRNHGMSIVIFLPEERYQKNYNCFQVNLEIFAGYSYADTVSRLNSRSKELENAWLGLLGLTTLEIGDCEEEKRGFFWRLTSSME